MSPSPYYFDEWVTLYHGKAEDILPALAPGSVDVLLTDPPFFNVKDEDWDRQWKQRQDFLAWLGGVLDLAFPLLTPAASVWMFAGPLMASAVEHKVMEPRLRVINSIRWLKDDGPYNQTVPEAQRRYLSPWEAILLAEPPCILGDYIRQERTRAGLSSSQLDVALGYARTADPTKGTGLTFMWEQGTRIPTPKAYEQMRVTLGPGYLQRDYEDLVRPFRLRAGMSPTSDVWQFASVENYPGKHPCEKPLALLRHMLDVSASPSSLVLDPFAGSGSTLRAAKDAGIRAVGIEKDRRWCDFAARRLAQDCLDLGGVA